MEWEYIDACDRAIEDTRHALRHGGYPMIKKEGDEVRCRGYIYSMNDCVCDRCKACKIQYGHPFDPYWNNKEDFVEYDEQSKNIQQLVRDICSFDYYKRKEISNADRSYDS